MTLRLEIPLKGKDKNKLMASVESSWDVTGTARPKVTKPSSILSPPISPVATKNPKTPLAVGSQILWSTSDGKGHIARFSAGWRPMSYVGRNKYAVSQGKGVRHDMQLWMPDILLAFSHDANYVHVEYIYAVGGTEASMDSPLGILPIPNMFMEGRPCLPEMVMSGPNPSPTDALNAVHDAIWHSGTNTDLNNGPTLVVRYGPQKLRDLINQTYTPPKGKNNATVSTIRILRTWERTPPEVIDAIDDWPQTPSMPSEYHTVGGFIESWLTRRESIGKKFYQTISRKIPTP